MIEKNKEFKGLGPPGAPRAYVLKGPYVKQ